MDSHVRARGDRRDAQGDDDIRRSVATLVLSQEHCEQPVQAIPAINNIAPTILYQWLLCPTRHAPSEPVHVNIADREIERSKTSIGLPPASGPIHIQCNPARIERLRRCWASPLGPGSQAVCLTGLGRANQRTCVRRTTADSVEREGGKH